MKWALLSRHRTLLFRSYLFLAAGLLAAAMILDLSFGYLHSRTGPQEDQWLHTNLQLIEAQLADLDAEGQDETIRDIARIVDVPIKLLDRDDVAIDTEIDTSVETLVDSDGNRSYLYYAPMLDRLIYFGPVETHEESLALQLLPPAFYLSIFVVTALWLRPMLNDVNQITSAAQRFAADYREPLSTASKTTQLTSLATYLDEMSSRLSGLIQNQKELIAALSHEMRTPLARIRFALAVIGNESNEDKRLHGKLDELNGDVHEVDQLIATMLNYARLDHPDLRMNWQQVPVDAWLAKIREKLHHPGKTLSIAMDDAFDTAWMDPHLMGLAVSNLLSNAGRHAKETIRCCVTTDDERVTIEVHDDGKGIPEEKRESVFKAFTRLDNSRNRETGGYGLGLAIVSRIAQLHGGTITVDKSPELGGARFTLCWPPPESLD